MSREIELSENRTSAFRFYQDLPIQQKKNINQKSNVLKKLTSSLLETFKNSSNDFNYDVKNTPRRALTRNKIPISNNDFDNSEAELIIFVNEILSTKDKRYQVLELLGSGTFGQVVHCKDLDTQNCVAIKIVKNLPAYFNQAITEIQILNYIKDEKKPVVHFLHHFVYQNHMCLVFELLSINLFELIKINYYQGLELKLIYCFAIQILIALIHLYDHGIIHCDLKPENILLDNDSPIKIKIVDFGSACFLNNKMYSYIQSRYYRSPEVILRLPYTQAIDMWSLGCIITELFIGLPLFPGHNEYDQLSRIIQLRGNIPKHLLSKSRLANTYFNYQNNEYQLKPREQYLKENQLRQQKNRKNFSFTNIKDLILNSKVNKDATIEIKRQNLIRKLILIDLLEGLLEIDPEVRWTPKEAIQHPFFTGQPFKGKFVPKKIRERNNYPPSNNKLKEQLFGIDVKKELQERYGEKSTIFSQNEEPTQKLTKTSNNNTNYNSNGIYSSNNISQMRIEKTNTISKNHNQNQQNLERKKNNQKHKKKTRLKKKKKNKYQNNTTQSLPNLRSTNQDNNSPSQITQELLELTLSNDKNIFKKKKKKLKQNLDYNPKQDWDSFPEQNRKRSIEN
ncbi:homeodomain interacting protein kinase isoform a [Anaeramoeba flamelloides]|uniref:Homeodomain interacting protein kinase isoform a n=1 Tax=Anaeramoeba flamelloides TaxID=1746091 RepID=A0AAV7YPS1_9EUKA|nr:homeodomain interacting protein kinase isoform a [Anaeramoeba flamelloides]